LKSAVSCGGYGRRDAQTLIECDECNAYYAAQRLAARSRALGDGQAFVHWAKVAAEVARRSSLAGMDYAVVKAIVDDELAKTPMRRNDGKAT